MAHLCRILVVASYAGLATAVASTSHYPDVKAAHQNAFELFNSIQSAMRQWGSSINHNGMSFYLATAPEGSIFYHGGYSPDRPKTHEWLAFEIEHSSQFAESWEPRDPKAHSDLEGPPSDDALAEILMRHRAFHHLPLSDMSDERRQFLHLTSPQRPISTDEDDEPIEDPPPSPPPFTQPNQPTRGYLQIYRTNRPLNLLYIDGQAAAKSPLGSLDSQDLILLGRDPSPGPGQREWQRATGFCALADKWAFAAGGKIDGFIRMEAGFEIIQCDFSASGGLDLVSVQASPFRNESGVEEAFLAVREARRARFFEWLRASAARFHGMPEGRLDVDWSSMVSAFAYPVNLSNPDRTRQDLPRVVKTTREERFGIRERLAQVITHRGGQDAVEKGVVNWQGVTDKIVTRFSERLWYMANGRLTGQALLITIGTVLDPYISYTDHTPMAERLAFERCTQHYLDPKALSFETWTPEDHAIAAAIERVSHRICDALFFARNILHSNSTALADIIDHPVEQAKVIIRQLMEELRWSTWKDCGKCSSPNEICSIPMFPMGALEDYISPSCKNITRIIENRGYWEKII